MFLCKSHASDLSNNEFKYYTLHRKGRFVQSDFLDELAARFKLKAAPSIQIDSYIINLYMLINLYILAY